MRVFTFFFSILYHRCYTVFIAKISFALNRKVCQGPQKMAETTVDKVSLLLKVYELSNSIFQVPLLGTNRE